MQHPANTRKRRPHAKTKKRTATVRWERSPNQQRVIYSGIATFAGQPLLSPGTEVDIAVIGVPFDAGTTNRPGARFGPAAIRQASRSLRPYHPAQRQWPFRSARVADFGDIECTPFDIRKAVEQVRRELGRMLRSITRGPVLLGGDHTISYPALDALRRHHGFADGVALVHFDSHLDTMDAYYGGEKLTHGTPFRRAAESGSLDAKHSVHIGVHGSLNGSDVLRNDRNLGFEIITTDEVNACGGCKTAAERAKRVVGSRPCYVSVDVDVVDPGMAPGTGTPESGGMTSFQLLATLRGLSGLNIIGGDVVEVAPAYDSADVTSTLAATVAYEIMCLMVTRPSCKAGSK
jgi:agmatinase